MTKRCKEKRITLGSRTLKFLRYQAGLSIRDAAKVSGLGDGVINHLEHGRIDIHERHLEKLLLAYGTTRQIYDLFASGAAVLPQNLQSDCIDLILKMSVEQLRTVLPVLQSLTNQRSF